MEEKIIIDGVDVSECRFYQETLKAYNNGKISSAKGYGFCTHNIKGLNNAGCYAENFARCLNNNCYYKQLKRLEEKYNKMVKISEENLIKYEDLSLDFGINQQKKWLIVTVIILTLFLVILLTV